MDKQKEPSKFEKCFAKTAVIVSWILAVPVYYYIFLLIFSK